MLLKKWPSFSATDDSPQQRDQTPMEIVWADGTSVPKGYGIAVDNHVQTFTIQVRTSNGTGPESLKDLIQTKFEVVSIEETRHVAVATDSNHPAELVDPSTFPEKYC